VKLGPRPWFGTPRSLLLLDAPNIGLDPAGAGASIVDLVQAGSGAEFSAF